MWMGNHGFVRESAHNGLSLQEYQRHENAQRDKSWSAQGIASDALLAQVSAYDLRVGTSLKLMQAFALRKKESVRFRPFEHVVPFAEAGLPDSLREADRYVSVKGKGGAYAGCRRPFPLFWRRSNPPSKWSVSVRPRPY